MRVEGLHHIQIAAPPNSEEQARAFYQDVLGLTEVAKPPNLARRGGVWFRFGSCELHVGIEADFVPARKAHPAFVVRDLDALETRLRERGIPTSQDEPLVGYQRFYTTDPFGNRLEFLEPTDERRGTAAQALRGDLADLS